MKAEERHRLKTNELAESLGQLPEYLRKHSSQIITWVIVVLIVLLGISWYVKVRRRGHLERQVQTQQLIANLELMQFAAARQSMPDPETGQLPGAVSYDGQSLASMLGAVVEAEQGTATGLLALLGQAEALRSQLLFSDMPLGPEQRASICSDVASLYEQALQHYPDSAWALGSAKLGLGMLAEDQGQWDVAREQYEQIAALAEGQLAGTVFPRRATQRLGQLDKLMGVGEFPVKLPTAADLLAPLPGQDAGRLFEVAPSGDSAVDAEQDESTESQEPEVE